MLKLTAPVIFTSSLMRLRVDLVNLVSGLLLYIAA